MSSSGGPKRNAIGRQASISSLEQGLNMVSAPPAIAPVTIYPGPGAKHANMAKADLEIVQRLQQLRQGSNAPPPSEAEMEERLAKLKDLPTDYYTKKSSASVLLNTDRRSDQQKQDDLLNQIANEVSLERKLPNPDEDIAARLAQLRCGLDAPVNPKASGVPSLDSPELPDVQDIKQLLKEVGASSVGSQSCKKREKDVNRKKAERKKQLAQRHKTSSSTEEDEKYSNSSDEGTKKKHRIKKFSKSLEKAPDAEDEKVDQAEVDRLVSYYTKRAQDKKKKKKGRSTASATTETVTDSSSELSDSGDATSDSEKLSHSSS